jgi:CRP/FNR family transcriptional regulator, cyclic AMP receptor protein
VAQRHKQATSPRARNQEAPVQNRKQRALADELAELPSLRSCGKDDVRALAEAGSVVTLPDGWAFVQEGTPADAAYILLDGEAKVLAGREVIATLSPGAILGEMAYVEGGQRKATVASSGRVRALRLDYDKLAEIVAKRPALKEMLRATDLEHRGGTK